MRRLEQRRSLFVGLLLMAMICGAGAHDVLAESAPARPSIKASALYMVELKSGRILLEKDATRRLPPASLTKVRLRI